MRSTSRTMLLVVTLLGVGGMYLAVSAKVADAGRQVLTLESRKAELQQTNDELSAQLASLTSPQRMLELANGLGFRPANPGEVEYLVVPGYEPPAPFVAPKPPAATDSSVPQLSPAYTETLGQWFGRLFSKKEATP